MYFFDSEVLDNPTHVHTARRPPLLRQQLSLRFSAGGAPWLLTCRAGSLSLPRKDAVSHVKGGRESSVWVLRRQMLMDREDKLALTLISKTAQSLECCHGTFPKARDKLVGRDPQAETCLRIGRSPFSHAQMELS